MKQKFFTLLGLILLIAMSYGLYIVIVKIISIFNSLNPTVAASMLAASATVLVSVMSVLLSKRQEQKVKVESELREMKTPIYEKIIKFIFLITFAEKLGKESPSEKEMMEFFADTTRDLVIWGSVDMIKAFGAFREGMIRGGEAKHIMATVEDLLFAVRKDLGHAHKNMKRGDILRLYINDLPDHFPNT